MFEAIKNFVTELADGNKAAGSFDDADFRLAFAALLVHAGGAFTALDGALRRIAARSLEEKL